MNSPYSCNPFQTSGSLDPRAAFAPMAERDYQRQRTMTLGDLLLENRVVFLQGELYDGNANELVMKLLYLQSENRRKDIHFYINSPGGSVTAAMAWRPAQGRSCLQAAQKESVLLFPTPKS